MIGACPVANLLDIADLVRKTHPALADWLADAVLDHVDHGISLDDLLGLNPGRNGKPSARYNYLRRRRNRHLHAALTDLGGDVSGLAKGVEAFLNVPEHVREGAAPPPEWPAWKCEIWRAARTGLPLPASVNGLKKTLKFEN